MVTLPWGMNESTNTSWIVDVRTSHNVTVYFQAGDTGTQSTTQYAPPLWGFPDEGPGVSLKDRRRILVALWSRQAILLVSAMERRLELLPREKAPRRHTALGYRQYVRPVHKTRVCSAANRYRVKM